MSTIANTIQQFATPDTSKQREQYTFLLKAAQAKMAVYKSELNEMFLNPEAVGKIQIIGKRALAYHEQYHVGLTKETDIVKTKQLVNLLVNFYRAIRKILPMVYFPLQKPR
jgi:hypothetical protein